MTHEDKELLFKDLSSRLPYGVKILVNDKVETLQGIDTLDNVVEYDSFLSSNIEEVRPYLFPLSSMTEEQRKELYKMGWYLDEDKIYSCFRNYDDANYKTHIDCFELVNWCYKNNFDINGLIPTGLAKDATNLNIY